MRVIEAPPPQGDILGDLFRYGVLSLQIYEGGRDTREEKDAIEQLGMVLVCFDPHVYSEVWTSNLSFYCKQLLEGPNIITLLQNMLVNNEVSHQTVGILLKYLMNNLESIGTQSKIEGALSLKLFKLSFMAVNQFIELNEPVLVPYLSKLIIDSFAYAAKAEDPSIYYQVLRALFRSVARSHNSAVFCISADDGVFGEQIYWRRSIRSALQGGPAYPRRNARNAELPASARGAFQARLIC